jgi:hypothetical protein
LGGLGPFSSVRIRKTSGQALRVTRAIAGLSIAAFALSATSSAAWTVETPVAPVAPVALAVIVAGVVLEIKRPTLTKRLRKR